MILADTSVWIDHLRKGVPALTAALEEGQVLMHPFVLGEIACGTLRDRANVLHLLQTLPAAPVASDQEALHYIERLSLMGRGIGFVEVHLLASAALAESAQLWTADLRLNAVAAELGLAFARPNGSSS